MKRVVYLDHAPYEGGAEVSLRTLLQKLVPDLEYQLQVIAPPDAPYLSDVPSSIHVPFVFHWKWYKTIIGIVPDLIKLLVVLRNLRPEIIHANTRVTLQLLGFMYLLRPLLPFLKNTVLIQHVRDRDPLPWWSQWLIGKADRVVANSHDVKRFLETYSIKVHSVIYNGVDTRIFNPQTPKAEIAPPVITFIGQVYPRKGVDVLLKAFAHVIATVPDAKLWIVGQDPTETKEHESAYKALAVSLGISESVIWMGYRTDTPNILAKSTVFVLPSLQEPFGRVIVEAMAMEVPVVATAVGGVPEIVVHQETGYLVEPADPAALSNTIMQVLNSPAESVQMAIQARKRVLEYFSLDAHVAAIKILYAS